MGDGRDLDAGRLSAADVDELVDVLAESGGAVDAGTVRLLMAWCERANLLRRPGKRLVRTQVSGPVVAEPEVLWVRLWRSFALLEDEFGADVAAVELLTGGGDVFPALLREALCGLCSTTEPLPLEHLVGSVLDSLRTGAAPVRFPGGEDDPARSAGPQSAGPESGVAVPGRAVVRRLLRRVLDRWELLGAVRCYTTDRAERIAEIEAVVPPGVRAERTMVELTPLGVWAARESLREFGLLAPSVQDVVRYPAEVLVLALPTSPPDVVEEVIGAWIVDRVAGAARRAWEQLAG